MTTFDGHATDHVMKFPKPSPSAFVYCKRSKTGDVEGLGMRLQCPTPNAHQCPTPTNAQCPPMPNAHQCSMPTNAHQCLMPTNSQCPPMPNYQCPMPNYQCPITNAQCPITNAQCPMPNAQCLYTLDRMLALVGFVVSVVDIH